MTLQLKFKQRSERKIDILSKDNVVIGHIFTPGGSGSTNKNSIQICGFTEAFDFWGCGVYKGFKDIQLLFDDKKMKGKDCFHNCIRCYRKPCQCEVGHRDKLDDLELLEQQMMESKNPFVVKREIDLKDRVGNND